MNKKARAVIGILIFALFIGGAWIAYKNLGRQNLPENSLLSSGKAKSPDGTSAKTTTNRNDEQDGNVSLPGSETDETSSGTDESGAGSENGEPAETNEEQRIEAPDFTVYDFDGNAFRMSDFIGKPTIINFWATWCPYCVDEMPYFEDSFKKYGEDINFVMIDSVDGQRETKEKAEKFIKKNGFTFPVYYDTDQTAVVTYGAYSLPTSVFIDGDGYVVAYHPGMLTAELLQIGIGLIYDKTE